MSNNELNHIFVTACVDGAALSDSVCDYAAWVAQRVNAPLKLLHTIDHHQEHATKTDLTGNLVMDNRDQLLAEYTTEEQARHKARIQEGKALLNAARDRLEPHNAPLIEICLQHGALIDSLVELEERIRILVIGARGRVHEAQRDQIGSKLESMIRSLHRPILVAYDQFIAPQKIMIAYNGKATSEKAIELVANSPLCQGLDCHLVSVSKKGINDSLLEAPTARLRNVGLNVTTRILEGKPLEALLNYQTAEKIDLTMMGAYSHTRLHDLIVGSFTTKMLLNTHTPLLLLR